MVSITFNFGQELLSFKTSDGETLYYSRHGKEPLLVMLYGGPGAPVSRMQSWADSLMSDFECVLFEQRGTRKSSKVKLDSTTINLKRAVNDLEDLRNHLKVDMINLCGISWGGMLSQSYAAYYPTRVKKMVLVSTPGPDMSFLTPLFDNVETRRYPIEKDSLAYWNNQSESESALLHRGIFWSIAYFYDHSKGRKLLPDYLLPLKSNKMADLMFNDLSQHYDLTNELSSFEGECHIILPM